MAKFFFFEYFVGLFYKNVFTAPKDSYGKPTQLGVTFASGYLAGVVCAVVSHPADSLVSQLGKPENRGKSLGAIASEVGFANLATKGLGTRVLMIGTLTGESHAFHVIFVLAVAYLGYRLPMVDLRFIQVCHGYGYDWWQINASPPKYLYHSMCISFTRAHPRPYRHCLSRTPLCCAGQL